MIQSFQISDNKKDAMLANDPNNELFKASGIITPASYVKTTRKRIKDYDCYSWWFSKISYRTGIRGYGEDKGI